MSVIDVASAQMVPRPTIRGAALAIVSFIKRAASRGATHLVTPEMILTGYHGAFDQAERDRAIAGILRPACARYRMTLIAGAGNKLDGAGRRTRKPFIQNVVIGPTGRVVGVHNKTIPTDGDMRWCRRGLPRNLRVFRSGGLTFGVTICNDFWATPGYTSLSDINVPVLLARRGARAIFHSIQSGHDPRYRDFHTRRIEERAIRARVWVVSANCAVRPSRPVNAPTGVCDPSGRWLARAPSRGEGLCVARIRVP